jgi:Leucine-rich repeat (LRR) protein
MENLRLRELVLEKVGLSEIPPMLGNLTDLQVLNLADNVIR